MIDVAAGIVLFNPVIERLKENIRAILPQVKLLVIVDNGSENISAVENEVCHFRNVIVLKNDNNYGVATGLNQIMSYCQGLSLPWVLTLDQDSVCPLNLVAEYGKYIGRPHVAIVSPIIIDRNKEKETSQMAFCSEYDYVAKCITSAALTSVDAWREVGGFDDSMFIDLVDFEFCDRLCRQSYKIIRVNSISIIHEIGHISKHRFLLWTILIKNHSAIRKYYMARNLIYFSRKRHISGAVVVACLRAIKLAILILLYENDKKEKLFQIIRGIREGRRMILKENTLKSH